MWRDLVRRNDQGVLLFVSVKTLTLLVTLVVLLWRPAWLFPILAINIAEAVVFAGIKGMWGSATVGAIVGAMCAHFALHAPSRVEADAFVALYVMWNVHFSRVAAEIHGYVTSAALNLVPALVYTLHRFQKSPGASAPTQGLWLFVLARCLVMIFGVIHTLDPASCHGFVRGG